MGGTYGIRGLHSVRHLAPCGGMSRVTAYWAVRRASRVRWDGLPYLGTTLDSILLHTSHTPRPPLHLVTETTSGWGVAGIALAGWPGTPERTRTLLTAELVFANSARVDYEYHDVGYRRSFPRAVCKLLF
jgi:hypothetical protein